MRKLEGHRSEKEKQPSLLGQRQSGRAKERGISKGIEGTEGEA